MGRGADELFDKNKIKKFCEKISITQDQRDGAIEWLTLLEKDQLKDEQKNRPKFEQIVLQKILGYTVYDFEPEKSNVDYSILDKSSTASLCIEVKGTSTENLDTVQKGRNKEHETPIKQTWVYMGLGYDYGLCTNFNKFQLLLSQEQTWTKSHRFEFDSIRDSKNKINEEKLREFIGLFSKTKIFTEKIFEKLRQETITIEKEFTDEFYKLYHETRLMLVKEFKENGNVPQKEAVHWAQIFLNRLIFIFFVEDHNFIRNQIFSETVINTIKSPSLDENSKEVFDSINNLFKKMNVGSKILGIPEFNGGLFEKEIPPKLFFPDFQDQQFFKKEIQNSKLSQKSLAVDLHIEISSLYSESLNPIIKNFLIMDSYDFTSDLNVNILGHIFEQSISDIEELKNENISKRKKFGIYYTPDYITDYICRNTIIPYLSKNNFYTVDDLVKEYENNLEELENKIKELKILDPACGSGAFLVKAVDILLEIDDEIQKYKPQSVMDQRGLGEYTKTREINDYVENNIYGVDLNEESTEITKLSLFLKLAGPDRKLSYLSNNIKVGNSIIDDTDVEDKAFQWENRFPEILSPLRYEKGFDIVIGNPPYLRIQGMHQSHENIIKFLENNYISATGKYDYYVLFIERGISLLKKNGILGFITPHKFTSAEFGMGIRKLLSEKKLLKKFVNFRHNFVFEDAAIYTGILILQNRKNKTFDYIAIEEIGKDLLEKHLIQLKNTDFSELNLENFSENSWNFTVGNASSILAKIQKHPNVMEFFDKIPQGIVTGDNDLFILKPVRDTGKTMIMFSNKTGTEVELEKELLKPMINGADVKKYMPIPENRFYILYPYFLENDKQKTFEENDLKKKFPLSYEYLTKFKQNCIEKKKKYKTNPVYWYSLHNSRNLKWFDKERIVTAQITLGCNMTLDSKQFLHNEQVYSFVKKSENNIDNKYYLGILNSKIMWYFMKNTGAVLRGGYFRFKTKYLEDFHIPIPSTKEIENTLIKKVINILNLNNDLKNKSTKFMRRLNTELNIEKLSKKLELFYDLSFNNFLAEVKKCHKNSLNLKEKDQWEDYFESYKKDILELRTKIDQIDNEINLLVYKIYGLTDEEILIVEENYPKNVHS